MRIHSNELTMSDFADVVTDLDGVTVTVTQHGSRSHARAFEVRLRGNGRTGGQWGNTDAPSATWDEWGVFLGRLYAIDPYMMCGNAKAPVYLDRDDFDYQTDYRFDGGVIPEDTHVKHFWDFVDRYTQSCPKCSAVRNTPNR